MENILKNGKYLKRWTLWVVPRKKGNQTMTHHSPGGACPDRLWTWGSISAGLDAVGLSFLFCKVETARHHLGLVCRSHDLMFTECLVRYLAHKCRFLSSPSKQISSLNGTASCIWKRFLILKVPTAVSEPRLIFSEIRRKWKCFFFFLFKVRKLEKVT